MPNVQATSSVLILFGSAGLFGLRSRVGWEWLTEAESGAWELGYSWRQRKNSPTRHWNRRRRKYMEKNRESNSINFPSLSPLLCSGSAKFRSAQIFLLCAAGTPAPVSSALFPARLCFYRQHFTIFRASGPDTVIGNTRPKVQKTVDLKKNPAYRALSFFVVEFCTSLTNLRCAIHQKLPTII